MFVVFAHTHALRKFISHYHGSVLHRLSGVVGRGHLLISVISLGVVGFFGMPCLFLDIVRRVCTVHLPLFSALSDRMGVQPLLAGAHNSEPRQVVQCVEHPLPMRPSQSLAIPT